MPSSHVRMSSSFHQPVIRILIAILLMTQSPVVRSFIFDSSAMIYQDDKTMAIIRHDPMEQVADCMLYDLESNRHASAAHQAVSRLNTPIFTATFKEMMSIIDNCRKLDLRQSKFISQMNELELMDNNTTLSSFLRGIVPGTKWCGLGDSANDYTDVGPRALVDSCCRAHDHCPIRLKPFRSGYGLVNLSLYTKSHCLCDDDFLKCLKSSQHPLADMLGNLYFNVMKFGCLKESNPDALSSSPSKTSNSRRCKPNVKRRRMSIPITLPQPMKRSPFVFGPSVTTPDPCIKENSLQQPSVTFGRASGSLPSVESSESPMEFVYDRDVRY